MAHGILLRLTHTGVSGGPIVITDVDRDADGPRALYVPAGGSALVVYGKTVPQSFESGQIHGFVDRGLLVAKFIFGTEFDLAVLPNIVEVTATPHALDVTTDYCLVNPLAPAAFTVNLPDGNLHEKKVVVVKDKAQMAGGILTPITINAFAGQTIEGIGSFVLVTNGASVTLVFQGIDWSVV